MSGVLSIFASVDAEVLFGFLAALLFLDAYDVLVPRSQGISINGPLVGAMVVLLHSPVSVIVAVFTSLAVHMVRGLVKGVWSGSFEMAIRLAASATAYGVSLAMAQSRLSVTQLVVVPAVYLLIEFVLRQTQSAVEQGRSIMSLIRSNGVQQSLLLAAQLSTATLTVVTQESMGSWSLIPVVALLLLMRQAYAMLLELHGTYRATVSILIEAAEAQLPEFSGHSDRTAKIAREIGVRCSLTSTELEMVEYAALLHDVDRISASDDFVAAERRPAEVIRDVEFLRRVVPILDLVGGERGQQPADRELMSAFIVALASDIDAEHAGISDKDHLLGQLAPAVPGRVKASVVSAALELGYPVPAID